MRVSVLSSAEFEPITVAQAKDYCRVTHTLEDTIIADLITSARELCEQASRVPISLQKFRAAFRWPKVESIYGLAAHLDDPDSIAKGIRIPRNPVVAVDEVRLVAEDGTSKVLDLAQKEYRVQGERIFIAVDENYTTGYQEVVITFDAGWPSNADSVGEGEEPVTECPALLTQCVKDTVAHLYRNRGDEAASLPRKVRNMLQAFAETGGYVG